MKNLLSFTFILFSVFLFGQAPQKMNYQEVVRNASGQPVANGTQAVFRFAIHDEIQNHGQRSSAILQQKKRDDARLIFNYRSVGPVYVKAQNVKRH